MSEQPNPRARRTRFVTLCQQFLALAVVLAVLTPAARTITMDVRPMPIGDSATSAAPATLSAYVRATVSPSRVPVGPVKPQVTNYELTAPRGTHGVAGAARAQLRRTATGGAEIATRPLPVPGFGGIGVTWAPGETLGASAIQFEARSLKAGKWSGWTKLGLDDGGPDAGTAEARTERPGTEMVFVGHVSRVQVRVDTKHAVPSDLRVSVVGPGTPAATRLERPAIDTSKLNGTPGDEQALLRRTTTARATTMAATTPTAAALGVTPKPQIYSRAQWGADERMRDKSSLHYGEVHAGFIHHTVQANDYSRADVPGLIRADYYYHTQVRGWSDIGYNYLIDRFGRIWEGRYGGVDRDPVGAHTLGYNDDSFAASAIGNYQVVQPSAAMVQAYAALFAWKLSLAGVKADATHQWVTSRYFNAINGHRDAGQTLCPGKYLYAKIPEIRTIATSLQASWNERQINSRMTHTSTPYLFARRATDGEGFVIPVVRDATGTPSLGRAVDTGIDFTTAARVLRVGDWDRDGFGDLVVRRRSDPQNLYLYRGLGQGRFAAPVLLTSAMAGMQMLAAAGDFTGDGYPDLLAETKTGAMQVFPGKGLAGLAAGYPIAGHIPVHSQLGVGRWDQDGAPDVLVRSSATTSVLYYGNGPGGFASNVAFAFNPQPYDQVLAVQSVFGNGHPDLIARERATGKLWVFPGSSSPSIEVPVLLGTAAQYNLIV